MSWSLAIPQEQLIKGLNVTCLVEDITTTTVSLSLVERQAQAWVRITRQQLFHLGLVRLFDEHPHLVAFNLKPEAAEREAKLSVYATPEMAEDDPTYQMKSLRAVEKTLGSLRGKSGTSREVISDILHNVCNRGVVRLTRESVPSYLLEVFGHDLYATRQMVIENKVLRAEVEQAVTPMPVRDRPRL